MGYSNLALTRLVPDKESKLAQYLGRVVTASERARDLIAKMLAYSRTQSTGQVGDLLPAPVVKEVSHMLSATIPSTMELALFVDDRTPAIRVDAVDLQQILVNLAINARDAIGEVGRIEIGLGPSTEVGGICALCQETVMGEFVALEVIDSGDGIAPENLGRIFDPFFTTKEVGKGSGLGLSMVQGIVKKSGGHVLIHSRPGQGTVFRILFPLAGAVAEAADPAARKPAPAEAKRIWVVDDEPSVAGYFDELLASQDYRVRTFDKPVEALRAFQETPEAVDLLITDQTMPGMSGSDLAQAMLKTRPDLPIYLCTGYSEHMDARRAGELGIRHFCPKPVDGGKLLATLAEEFAKTPRGT
jgi:CheY-like chemotaxis protein